MSVKKKIIRVPTVLATCGARVDGERCSKATSRSDRSRQYQGTTDAEYGTAMGHMTRTGKGATK